MSKIIDAGNGLQIEVSSNLREDGVPTRYDIINFDTEGNEFATLGDGFRANFHRMPIVFTVGMQESVREAVPGTLRQTGVTLESLLLVCKLRLEALQSGAHPCDENDLALQKIEEAIMHLDARSARAGAQVVSEFTDA